ncbi:site-specific integrase [Sphingomonas sp. BN140010]|uniref:Site-specific integrase n=1 Tax=Sphingomonas arvum TaxID=2992113 RepID=A0ABT3JE97_9SPHN|nr:site-specific integrase [Sphingomonas sp. BN140010]MCW3797397.1 site-specific integrase [Sphingomonas sp. BN140010]
MKWAAERESMILSGRSGDLRPVDRSLTLRSIVERYLREITPSKRSNETERYRLEKLLRDPVSETSLSSLSAAVMASYRDRRAAEVRPGTIRRELSLMNHMLDLARREWGISLFTNPVAEITKPKLNNARSRRLKQGEWLRLRAELEASGNPWVLAIVELAIETGLRRGEILDLHWSRIEWRSSTAFIPHTKTDKPRTIPLTPKAIAILQGLTRCSDRVFDTTPNAVKLAWRRATVRAKLADLRFHDLRHEAVSRFFELGLSLPEVALISGHRDPRMLMRYTHLCAADLATKLARMKR